MRRFTEYFREWLEQHPGVRTEDMLPKVHPFEAGDAPEPVFSGGFGKDAWRVLVTYPDNDAQLIVEHASAPVKIQVPLDTLAAANLAAEILCHAMFKDPEYIPAQFAAEVARKSEHADYEVLSDLMDALIERLVAINVRYDAENAEEIAAELAEEAAAEATRE